MQKIFTLFLVLFFGLITVASPAFAGILFYDDAENNYSSSDWTVSGDAPSFTTEQKRTGKGSYKFTQSSGSKRSELSLKHSSNPPINNFDFNKEYWIGFSIYVPNNIPSISDYMITGQFHDTLKEPDCDVDAQNPMFGMQLQPNGSGYHYYLYTRSESQECGDKNYENSMSATSSNIKMGGWNDVVIHTKFNYNSSGITQVWINGQKVMDHTKANAYNDNYGPYLKIGVYVGTDDRDKAHTVYFDEIRIGDAKSSYNEVAPNGGSTEQPPTNELEAPRLQIVSGN